MRNKTILLILILFSFQANGSELIDAINNGLRSKVMMLIEKEDELNSQDSKGFTGLMLAIKRNDEKIVDMLLTKNLDLNKINNEGQTALMVAIENGNINIITKLLNKNVDLEKRDKKDMSALQYAVLNNNYKIIDLLLSYNVDLNAKDGNGGNILTFLSSSDNNLEIIRYLVSKNANVNVKNNANQNLLHIATQNSAYKLVDYYLEKKIDLNELDFQNKNVLHYAIQKRDLALIEKYLSYGVNIKIKDKENKTPFDYATSSVIKEMEKIWNKLFWQGVNDNNLNLTKKILDSAVEADFKNLDKKTAMDLTLEKEYKEMFLLLIKNTPDFKGYLVNLVKINDIKKLKKSNDYIGNNEFNKLFQGEVLLNTAVKYKNFEGLKFLIDKGFDANENDNLGNTPLIVSLQKLYFDISKFLIENRANVNVENISGETPLFLALISNNIQLAQLLYDAGGAINKKNVKGENLFSQLIGKNKNDDIFRFFSDKNFDFTLKDSSGKGLMHKAVSLDDYVALDYLLKNTNIINNVDLNNKTPLHYAIENKNKKAVKRLVIYGADLKIKDSFGKTPLEYASDEIFSLIDNVWQEAYLEAINTNNLDLLKKSIDEGVLLNQIFANNKTALNIAYLNNSKEVYDFLISRGAYDKEVLIMTVKNNQSDKFLALLNNTVISKTESEELYFLALEKKSLNIIKKLIELNFDIDIKNNQGKTLLMSSIENKNSELSKLLIEKTKKIDEKDINGKTALFYAVENLDLELIKKLIDKGAKVNTLDNLKNSVMFNLVKKDSNIDIIKYLVDKGINLNTKNSDMDNVLLVAGKNKAIKNLDYLIGKGADINTVDSNGESLLFLGAKWNNEKFVEYLLEKGININLQNSSGYRAGDYANEDIKYTIEHRLTDKLINALYDGNVISFKEAYEKGADYSYKDDDGNNILLIATRLNSLEITKYLIDHGFRLNATNTYGRNALHVAIIYGSTNIAKLLITKGIDVKQADNYGKTPLNLAIEYNNLSVADLLMKKIK